jgi:hypothetical protein
VARPRVQTRFSSSFAYQKGKKKKKKKKTVITDLTERNTLIWENMNITRYQRGVVIV